MLKEMLDTPTKGVDLDTMQGSFYNTLFGPDTPHIIAATGRII